LSRDRHGVFRFAALQNPVARRALETFGESPDDPQTFYALVNYGGERSTLLNKSRATLFVLSELGWPWRMSRALELLPRSVLDAGYDLVARSRYRLFGRLEQCLVPTPEYRARFLDD
jgi:predicted DCC family thiol-disulfide oxidoreductase YuxK